MQTRVDGRRSHGSAHLRRSANSGCCDLGQGSTHGGQIGEMGNAFDARGLRIDRGGELESAARSDRGDVLVARDLAKADEREGDHVLARSCLARVMCAGGA